MEGEGVRRVRRDAVEFQTSQGRGNGRALVAVQVSLRLGDVEGVGGGDPEQVGTAVEVVVQRRV